MTEETIKSVVNGEVQRRAALTGAGGRGGDGGSDAGGDDGGDRGSDGGRGDGGGDGAGAAGGAEEESGELSSRGARGASGAAAPMPAGGLAPAAVALAGGPSAVAGGAAAEAVDMCFAVSKHTRRVHVYASVTASRPTGELRRSRPHPPAQRTAPAQDTARISDRSCQRQPRLGSSGRGWRQRANAREECAHPGDRSCPQRRLGSARSSGLG